MQGMTISVTGGSQYDNAQMCSVLQSALQSNGFTNVSLDAGCGSPMLAQRDMDTVNACRLLNPDLFDTPLNIEGVCEHDALDYSSISVLTNPSNWAPMPAMWGVANPFASFIQQLGMAAGTPASPY